MKTSKKLNNNRINNGQSSNLVWKSLDLETKIAIPVILILIFGIFIFNIFGGGTKK